MFVILSNAKGLFTILHFVQNDNKKEGYTKRGFSVKQISVLSVALSPRKA